MRAALALLAAAAVGCAEAEPPEPTVQIRAVYLAPLYDGQAARLDHEAVPGRMPSMEMAFRIRRPGALEGITPGTPVVVTVDSASLTQILAVEPLPAGTLLDLSRDEVDALTP